MGSLDDIKNYFAAHTTQAHFVKGAISYTVGFMFSAQPAVIDFFNSFLPAGIASFAGIAFGSIILAAHDWMSNHPVIQKWPIVGASATKMTTTTIPIAADVPVKSDRTSPPKV